MGNKKFILQGFTPESHRKAIADLFKVDDIQRIIVSVAFVNSGGVKLLEAEFKKHCAKATAFIGIRNDITSLQAAKRLLDLGITLYVVDTGSRSVIYHPKIYLVKGKRKTNLIIGSANLTPGGLNNNIEASILTDYDMTRAADRLLVKSIEKAFDEQPKKNPKNVLEITTGAQLDDLLDKGLLVDETIAAPPKPATSGSSQADDSVPRIKLEVPSITVRIAAAKKKPANEAPPPAKIPAKKGGAAKTKVSPPQPALGVAFELVWQSKPLVRRDLNIPNGKNTNPTGSMSLDKGVFPEGIDQRHYFREEIFDALIWTPSRLATVEEAYAKAHLVIKGISRGEYDLRIAHTKGTTSKSYKDGNAMTRLSWGAMKAYVRKDSLLKRTLSLYRDLADPKRFILEID